MYWTTNQSVAQTFEYQKRLRECEKQWAYMRSIVCSVPARSIAVNSIDIEPAERCEPG